MATMRELYRAKAEAYSHFKGLLEATADVQPTAEQSAEMDLAEEAMDVASANLKSHQEAESRRDKLQAAADELEQAKAVASPSVQVEKPVDIVDRRALADRLRGWAEEGKNRAEILEEMVGADNEQSRDVQRATSQWLMRGQIDPNLRSKAALQMDSDTLGGYLVMPERFVAQLIQTLDEKVDIRGLANVISLADAESLGAPSLDTDIADTNWTTELLIGTADSSMAFGKRRLTPHVLAKYILVSKDLLRTAAISVEAIVRERLAYKFGTVQEAAFMTGSGSAQPLGLFTASSNGISTGRDISTDNTTTAITADGLINAKYKLTSAYLAAGNLRWIFHRDAVKMIRKLKDGNGQYIWRPGLAGDSGDQILDVPVVMSEWAPNTFTTGLYVGLIGDLSHYWIADAMGVEIQRLVELGAATNQDYFIGRLKTDGMPIQENAFARVTLT